ncbi:MAG TPA: M56 family metallopeptidase [Candidatus Saccharimonadales bacterium]|nr:M56 family metallopeptidase [Candidatus Saccharimonadales bacterium]
MNFPNFAFWSHLLVGVGLEICGLAALAWMAQRAFRPVVWQRAVWRMAVVCLLLLPASEWTGFGRGAAAMIVGQKRSVENPPASVSTTIKLQSAGQSLEPGRASSAPPPAVWWPGGLWLAGMLLILARMGAVQVFLLVLRWRREKITTPPWRERILSVAKRVGLRRGVCLLRMPKSISPMAFGILQPSIGLPPGFETRFSMAEQDAVLAHELAHLAAMDPLWFWLADLASALLWWHPLVWWVRRSLHGAAELAADEATALVPEGPGALAHCLVNLGKEMTAARGWGWIGINGGFRSKLGQRVERLTQMPSRANRPSSGWAKVAVAIFIIPALLLVCGFLQSAPGEKKDGWRDELRASWNSSPGAVLLLAAAEDKPVPAPRASDKRAAILSKLERIRLPEVGFDLSLPEALSWLQNESKRGDPAGVGVNFMIDTTARAEGPGFAPLDMRQVRIKISTPLHNLPLADVLDAITKVADGRIQYLTTDYAVVFSPRWPEITGLYSKVYQVNPRAFVHGLEETSGRSESGTYPPGALNEKLKNYLAAHGVNFDSPGKSVFFNDRTGVIVAHLSSNDLEIVTRAVAVLDPYMPQLVIESKFTDVTEELLQGLSLNLTEPAQKEFTATLTEKQRQTAVAAIERAGADILDAPRVTTLSGWQTCIGPKGSENMTLNLISTVKPDKFSIATVAVCTATVNHQTWTASDSRDVLDGHTLVFGAAIRTNQSSGAREFRVIFVTPIIIDPAGNRVHSDEEILSHFGP